jgi:hypothetical protein
MAPRQGLEQPVGAQRDLFQGLIIGEHGETTGNRQASAMLRTELAPSSVSRCASTACG